ncbi:hypothetical protein CC85DRAFT_286191 [Cutaneotrichosporon oleaginosum]|uniref:Uncharacterized protein n=1 Tax=Cutaneotrichosporon oleaginosum TaxID=879819 RepID=A0A0J0XL19_9TREE|nr:uncharacterized protein CC85DRAFT_286191 [Cutaneotrichosporon oleaginosum]KLT41796.1 hypothetical protein CC85DRAFT_286191 [Cutaneotrichosporon oleaginosum]TXT12391.1 hypothetical protein COLE_02801 [Cutaneotrichosporon oleaginosum]
MKSIIVETSKQPTFLYKVTPGPADSSNAAECALLHGIDPEVVDRAREVSHLIATNQITTLIDQHLDDEDIEEMAQHEELVRRFLNWDLEDDEIDVLGELELIVQAAGIQQDENEVVPLGEMGAGISALERSVATESGLADIY